MRRTRGSRLIAASRRAAPGVLRAGLRGASSIRVGAWTRLGGSFVFGAPIFVHWSVLVAVGLLLLVAFANPVFGTLFLGSYLAIIFGHELGHAFVARRLGYAVDSIGVTILHGWCRCEAPRTEWDAVLVAWGGVAAQLVMAVPVVAIAAVLWDRDWGYLTPIIVCLGYLNLGIAAVNLLPGDADVDGKIAWRVIPLLLEDWRACRATRSARDRPKRW